MTIEVPGTIFKEIFCLVKIKIEYSCPQKISVPGTKKLWISCALA